jgi:hypothetical protein
MQVHVHVRSQDNGAVDPDALATIAASTHILCVSMIQVHVRVLSQDKESMDPDTMAINAASLACTLSNVPWSGPVGYACVRVCVCVCVCVYMHACVCIVL